MTHNIVSGAKNGNKKTQLLEGDQKITPTIWFPCFGGPHLYDIQISFTSDCHRGCVQ